MIASFTGMLKCGRPMDLSWVDVESLLVSVAVVKDTPECDDWMFSDPNFNVNEFMETNQETFLYIVQCKVLYWRYGYSNSFRKNFGCFNEQKKNSFPKFKRNVTLGTAQQYNVIVNYMITKKFGVKAAYIRDYETLVKHFSELLWEIDPHYLKLLNVFFRNSREKLSWI